MSQQDLAVHYVCTHEQARQMTLAHNRFWVSNCGCREQKGQCRRSRMDICLMYRDDIGASGSGLKEISLTEIMALFEETSEKHLVARPFRNDVNKGVTDGICFCCDDCCGYFTNPTENKCDKGNLIESTNMDQCNFCGDCESICYFGARKMVDGELTVIAENCYGCGLCAEHCPQGCVTMAARV